MPSIYGESVTTKSGTSEPLILAGSGVLFLVTAAGAAVGGVLRSNKAWLKEPPLGAVGLEVGGLDVSRCGAIDSGAVFDPLRRRHDLAVNAVLPYPELVDEHEHLRAVLVVADALREEVHVLRNHERHPR
jgi:hypothetical protein